jgi:hypothetical protein
VDYLTKDGQAINTTYSDRVRYTDPGQAGEIGLDEVNEKRAGTLCWYLSDNLESVRFKYPDPTLYVRREGVGFDGSLR